MSKKSSLSRDLRRERVEGVLRLGELDYPFVVYRQAQKLGAEGGIDYWYMVPSQFRSLGDDESIENFRSCIGYWFAGAHERGLGNDLDQLRTLVLATSYQLFSKQRGLQQVYRDAFLKPGSIDPAKSAPTSDDLQRIREVVASRDHFRLQQELNTVFEADMPSAKEMTAFAGPFAQWMDTGVKQFQHQGAHGLDQWVEDLDQRIKPYIKNSKTPLAARAFVRFFAYRAKISFYLCYANFWLNLIPWLKQHHGLDEVSARFLRLWHNQNPPIRIPRGRTAGGLIYPTQGQARLLLPDEESGQFVPREISWETPPLVPEEQLDVFSGQVLALHPLTWFFFDASEASALAARFFRLPEFDTIMSANNAANCPEYWELVRAILIAAYTYRNAQLDFENKRHVKVASGDSTLAAARDDAPAAIDSALRDYVSSQSIRCGTCNERLKYDNVELSESDDESRPVHLKCPKCGATLTITVTAEDFERFLRRDE